MRRRRLELGSVVGAVAALVVVVGACGRSVDLDDGDGDGGSTSSTSTGSKSTGSKSTGSKNTGSNAGGGGASSAEGGASPVGSASTGVSDGGSSSTGVICSGFGDACTECESASCADVWCSCLDNQDCLGAYSCWNDCMPGDTACIQACSAAHEAGLGAALLVSDCAATTCQVECGWGQDVPPCTECLYKNCAAVAGACIDDPECVPLSQCLNACAPSSIQCQQQCYADHGEGVDPLQAVIDCSAMECASVCD